MSNIEDDIKRHGADEAIELRAENDALSADYEQCKAALNDLKKALKQRIAAAVKAERDDMIESLKAQFMACRYNRPAEARGYKLAARLVAAFGSGDKP